MQREKGGGVREEVGEEGRVARRSLGCLIWGQLHSCLGVCKDAECFKIQLCPCFSLSPGRELEEVKEWGDLPWWTNR